MSCKLVYKYPYFLKQKKFTLQLPVGWKFLTVMVENEKLFLWAEVRDGVAKENVDFEVFGTGQEIPLTAEYLYTYTVGPFNFHLYMLRHVI